MSRSDYPFCSVTGDGIILSLHIQPRASKNEICGIHGNELKIRLTSPPVDGAANKLCREFIARIFDVPKASVEIISGETSRHKRLNIKCNDTGRLARIADNLASPERQ